MSPTHAQRRAGICIPLFSLRSSGSWGIGEIEDVVPFASWLRSAHQSVLQILPLNELAPDETSPYSALSAMALDPRYISIGSIEDAVDFEQIWSDEIREVRRADRIAYAQVVSLKQRALRVCFDRFVEKEWRRGSSRGAGLQTFISDQAWWLDDYSLYRALRTECGEKPWTEWEPALRDRDPAALAAIRERWSREILFYQYVQWIAAGQWQKARLA